MLAYKTMRKKGAFNLSYFTATNYINTIHDKRQKLSKGTWI